MAVYGPVRHQTNIWTEASEVHIIFFWWRTGPYTAIWPEVTWSICYIILFISNNNAGTVLEPNRKRGSPVPVHITLYWPAALTKTNRENKNVKYNIYKYINIKIECRILTIIKTIIRYMVISISLTTCHKWVAHVASHTTCKSMFILWTSC
jgi:hypothetical protein